MPQYADRRAGLYWSRTLTWPPCSLLSGVFIGPGRGGRSQAVCDASVLELPPCYYILTIVAAGLTANGNVPEFQTKKVLLGADSSNSYIILALEIAVVVGAVEF